MSDPILLRVLANKFASGQGTTDHAAWALFECADYIESLRTTIQMLVEEPTGDG